MVRVSISGFPTYLQPEQIPRHANGLLLSNVVPIDEMADDFVAECMHPVSSGKGRIAHPTGTPYRETLGSNNERVLSSSSESSERHGSQDELAVYLVLGAASRRRSHHQLPSSIRFPSWPNSDRDVRKITFLMWMRWKRSKMLICQDTGGTR